MTDELTPARRHLAKLVSGGVVRIRDLAEASGVVSTNAVRDLLVKMRAAGLVSWEPHKCATLRLTPKGRRVLAVAMRPVVLTAIDTPVRCQLCQAEYFKLGRCRCAVTV